MIELNIYKIKFYKLKHTRYMYAKWINSKQYRQQNYCIVPHDGEIVEKLLPLRFRSCLYIMLSILCCRYLDNIFLCLWSMIEPSVRNICEKLICIYDALASTPIALFTLNCYGIRFVLYYILEIYSCFTSSSHMGSFLTKH